MAGFRRNLRKTAGRLQKQPCMAFARPLRCLRRAFWRHSFCVQKLSGDSISSSGVLFELNFFGRLRDFYEAYEMLIQTGGSCLPFGSAFLPQDWMILKVFLVVIGGTAYLSDFSCIPEAQKEDKKAIAKAVLRSFLKMLAILAVVWVVSLLFQWIR